MEGKTRERSGGLVLSSIIIGISLIVCAILLGSAAVKVKSLGQTITVTGAAYKPIMSDYAVWNGYMNASAPTLDAAYAKIKRDLVRVKAFLDDQGFSEDDYTIGTVNLHKSRNREQVITAYNLGQNIRVQMPDVPRITKLAKDASTLIEQGIEFESRAPQYIFTKLDSLKIEMIRLATENAKLRAEELASASGMAVGSPRSARVGVFQIRPLHSQAVSDYGINDQSSIEKEIGCTVHINFLIQ